MRTAAVALLLCALVASAAAAYTPPPKPPAPIKDNFTDWQLFQLALNLEYLEAEFYLFSAYGYGLDHFAPELVGGGPPPTGGKYAALSPDVRSVAAMLGLQEIGHVRIIRSFLGQYAFPRPQLDIGAVWQVIANHSGLDPGSAFDPYTSDIDWLMAAYNIPYVGLTGYVGSGDYMSTKAGKHLLGGVLGVEGGQDAMLRTFLWARRNETVPPYGLAVKQITNLFKNLANTLTHQAVMENIVVPLYQGSEMNTTTNILASNESSISFQRTPAQVLATVYGTGHAEVPGGFFPKGANGAIPQSYL